MPIKFPIIDFYFEARHSSADRWEKLIKRLATFLAFPIDFACGKLIEKVINDYHLTMGHCNHKCKPVAKCPDQGSPSPWAAACSEPGHWSSRRAHQVNGHMLSAPLQRAQNSSCASSRCACTLFTQNQPLSLPPLVRKAERLEIDCRSGAMAVISKPVISTIPSALLQLLIIASKYYL